MKLNIEYEPIRCGGKWEMKFYPSKTKEEEIKSLIKCLYGWKIK